MDTHYRKKKGRDKKQKKDFDELHTRICLILKKNRQGLTRKDILEKAKIGSRRTLRKHLNPLKNASLIKEDGGKIFWKIQFDRLKVIEKLVESFAVSLEEQIQSQLIEEKLTTRFTPQEIANYIMNTQVLMFVPTTVGSKEKQITRYDLTYVSVDDFNSRFEEVWSNIKRRRELRQKNLIEKI